MALSKRIEELKEKVKEFPKTPGVYLMKNQREKIIYIGKAKNLRNRVRSYFSQSSGVGAKTQFLVSQLHYVEYILTQTEVESFLLEASLIKKHRPRYNIRLKDDKSYPYIRVSTQDQFPRIYLSRKVKKDGSLYFGPYSSSYSVWGTIRFLNSTFSIRDCKDSMMKSRSRPCMTHQIGRCSAPCVDMVTEKEYGKNIKNAIHFLRGKNENIIDDLTQSMKEAATEERFELAAKFRDSVYAIENILEKQSVINDKAKNDQDALGFYGDDNGTLIETLHIRKGRMIGNRSHFIPILNCEDAGEDPRDWLTSFINQYYEENIIPDEILLPVDIGKDLTALLSEVLQERTGHGNIKVRFATDNNGQDLIRMANENAKSHFQEHVTKSKKKLMGLEVIQKKLHLPHLPRRIECYDISHFQGAETVASQVVFEEGVPSKEHYRRYKLKSIQEPNDYASMKEVLERRFKHKEYDDPQLVLVDGGKGQLNVAVRILKEIGREDVPVASIAKARTERNFKKKDVDGTEERFYLPGRQNPVTFRQNSEAFHILVGLRDEAHRFAISFHRKLREATSLESELDMIVGLGSKRKKTLLKKYQSMDEIRLLDPEELAGLPGFNRVLAQRILLELNEGTTED